MYTYFKLLLNLYDQLDVCIIYCELIDFYELI